MTISLYDSFSGTGSIDGRTPDIALAGGSWMNFTSPAMSMASGQVGVSSGRGQSGISPLSEETEFTVEFSLITGGALPTTEYVGTGLTIYVAAGAAIYLYLTRISGNWEVYFSDIEGGGTAHSVTLATGTTYPGTIKYSPTAQRLTFLGITVDIAIDTYGGGASGVTDLYIAVQEGFALGPITLGTDDPGAPLLAPSATAAAFGGANAAIIAPIASCAGADLGSTNSAGLSSPPAKCSAFSGGQCRLVLPAGGVWATGHNSLFDRAAFITLPPAQARSYGGGSVRSGMPIWVFSCTATTGTVGASAMICPAANVVGSGNVGAIGSGTTHAPAPKISAYSGAVCATTIGTRVHVSSGGLSGGTGGVRASCPLVAATIRGSVRALHICNIVAPAAQLGNTAQAEMLAPHVRLVAVGAANTVILFGAYALNLKHAVKTAYVGRSRAAEDVNPINELTEYSNFPFDYILRYQDRHFGVAADALYLLGGETDDGAPIGWGVQTAVDDFGTDQLKTLEMAYIGGRVGTDLTVTVLAGETGEEQYDYHSLRDNTVRNHRQAFGRGVKNRYFALALAGDAELTIDSIKLNVSKMTRRI